MKDPDMTFLRGQDGDYYPMEFQQDNMGIYQNAVIWEGDRIQSWKPVKKGCAHPATYLLKSPTSRDTDQGWNLK